MSEHILSPIGNLSLNSDQTALLALATKKLIEDAVNADKELRLYLSDESTRPEDISQDEVIEQIQLAENIIENGSLIMKEIRELLIWFDCKDTELITTPEPSNFTNG